MGAWSAATPKRLAERWRTSVRSPDPTEAATLRRRIAAEQPRLWPALVADASVTARFRGEHHRFRSGLDAAIQILRLAWVTESFFAQVCYRMKVACRARGIPVLPSVLHHLSVMSAQVVIGDQVVVSPGLYLPHGQVVVDGLTFLGKGVVLRPFVTLGLIDGSPVGPRLGSGTMVGTGAKVIGPVKVGPGVQIGANAVVIDDVPKGATVVGVPARIVG